MKKILAVVIFFVLLLVGGYLLYKNQSIKPDGQIVGNDRDAHGCIGSAGYSWCDVKNKCLRVWEEPCDAVSVDKEIQTLLANKYSKPMAEVNVTISKQDGNFVAGSVLFGAGGPGEGGMFLARKVNNVWELVFDGNGNVDCAKMRQVYGFPDTVLKPNFCD